MEIFIYCGATRFGVRIEVSGDDMTFHFEGRVRHCTLTEAKEALGEVMCDMHIENVLRKVNQAHLDIIGV